MAMRVGIIGANPDRGWAARAHVPAIKATAGLRLTAVATTRRESAARARERFGAEFAFTDAAELVASPKVDLVVIAVKVPAHAELVDLAVAAGKHVYCEWPLSRTAAEAQRLAADAHHAGVRGVVGLQARYAPAVNAARALLERGDLGEVLSATVYSSRAKGNTIDVPAWTAYTYDIDNRAGLAEVLGGHALDLTRYLLGPITTVVSRTAIRSPRHRIAETGAQLLVTSPDHLAVIAEHANGAVTTLHLHDAEGARPRTRVEIAGTDGNLALVSVPDSDPWAAQLQISRLTLSIARRSDPEWRPVSIAADAADALPAEATNVARLYAALSAGEPTPSFTDAQSLHALIEQSQR
jgi:predicted dehydrogenase